MKSVITGFGGVLTLFLVILIQGTILNFGIRQNELDTAMNNAMIETQRVLYEQRDAYYDDGSLSIDLDNTSTRDEQYKDVFVKNLLQYIDSNSEIEVWFYDADAGKGLLDVEARAKYTNLVGQEKEYISRRTSILDVVNNYSISFDIYDSLQVDMSDTKNFIDRASGQGTIDIKIVSGIVNSVTTTGEATISHKMTGDDGKTLRIELKDVKSDLVIKIE